jgi:hypothetical protein
VTYRVRFEAYALVQLNGLPSEAFDALLDRVVELVEEPWDAIVMPPLSAMTPCAWGLSTAAHSVHSSVRMCVLVWWREPLRMGRSRWCE